MSTALITKTKFQNIFSYLESIAKNSYARIYLTHLGFDTSNSWQATQLEMTAQLFDQNNQLKDRDTLLKLKKVTLALHLTNYHIIQLIQGDAKIFSDMRLALATLVVTPNEYSTVFPFEYIGKMTSTGFPVLTKVEKTAKGTAIFFSTPKVKKIKVPYSFMKDGQTKTVMLEEDIIKHIYEVVYIPNDDNRIELRISGDTYKKDIEVTLNMLKQAFYDVLRGHGIDLTSLTIVQLEKSIINLYNQENYGIVVDTKFISEKNKTLMPRSNKRTDNCLRDQQYHKAGEKVEIVKCVGVTISFKKRTTKKHLLVTTKLHLECDPSSDYSTCNYFTLENPLGNVKALEIIKHMIKSNT